MSAGFCGFLEAECRSVVPRFMGTVYSRRASDALTCDRSKAASEWQPRQAPCDNQDVPPSVGCHTINWADMESSFEPTRRPVAYRDEDFLDSPEGRPLRIISEYAWPLAHFQEEKIQDTIVFFGSARIRESGPLSNYYYEAREL